MLNNREQMSDCGAFPSPTLGYLYAKSFLKKLVDHEKSRALDNAIRTTPTSLNLCLKEPYGIL